MGRPIPVPFTADRYWVARFLRHLRESPAAFANGTTPALRAIVRWLADEIEAGRIVLPQELANDPGDDQSY